MVCSSYHISEDISVSYLTPVIVLTHHIVQYYNIVMLYNMYNIPIQVMDHLSGLLSSAFSDSKIASEFSCKHTKTLSDIKNVLAKQFWNELEAVLKCTLFSVIIDESTDISTNKQLPIVVKFLWNKV